MSPRECDAVCMLLCEGPTLDLLELETQEIYEQITHNKDECEDWEKKRRKKFIIIKHRKKQQSHSHTNLLLYIAHSKCFFYINTKIYIKHSIKSPTFMLLLMCNDDTWNDDDDDDDDSGWWSWNFSNDTCFGLCILHYIVFHGFFFTSSSSFKAIESVLQTWKIPHTVSFIHRVEWYAANKRSNEQTSEWMS